MKKSRFQYLKKNSFLVCVLAFLATSTFSQTIEHRFDFYSETVLVPSESVFLKKIKDIQTYTPQRVYTYAVKEVSNDWELTAKSLNSYKDLFQLNDFLFFQLIQKYSEAAFENANSKERIICEWVLLNELNFDAMLAFDQDNLAVAVRSGSGLVSHYSFQGDNGSVYELLESTTSKNLALNQMMPYPHPGKRNFDFIPKNLPIFPSAHYEWKTLNYRFAGEKKSLKVPINKDHILMMKRQPAFSYLHYLDIPMDPKTLSVLRAHFLDDSDGAITKEDLAKHLLAFVRGAFTYMEDSTQFGNLHRSLSAEETMFYSASDCEDRSALYYQLQKELIGNPMIVYEFPNHLSVATSFEKDLPYPISYKNHTYYLTDPTVPDPDFPIGSTPDSMKDSDKKIVKVWEE